LCATSAAPTSETLAHSDIDSDAYQATDTKLTKNKAKASVVEIADQNKADEVVQGAVSHKDAGQFAERTNQVHELCLEGERLRKSNDLVGARAILTRACSLDPNHNSAAAHNLFGLTLMGMADLQGALAEFNNALSFAPDMAAATMNLAECYKQLGQNDQAIIYYKKFLSEHPDAPQASTIKSLLKAVKATPKVRGEITENDYFESATQKGVFRWPQKSMPLRVCIDPGTDVQGYRVSFRPLIFRSLNQWKESANSHVTWRLVADPKDASMVFHWTSNKDDFPHGAEQGLTRISWRGHCIEHADIKLCTVPIGQEAGKVLSDSDMEFTILHEIGHALGLSGHSPNNHDLMFFCAHPYPLTELSARDQSTIARLYGTPLDERQTKGRLMVGIPGLFGFKF
jgi:tetratricopeptide (TPR) repeat protein